MHQRRLKTGWAAPALGAVLFAAGVGQARKLAAGGVGVAQRAARTTGPTRIGIASLLLAKPQLMARLLHGNDHADGKTRLTLRMFAVRELALGVGTLLGAGTGSDVRRWLLVLALVDTGEALILLPAIRRGTVAPTAGLALVVADLGSSTAGAGVLVQLLKERHGAKAVAASP